MTRRLMVDIVAWSKIAVMCIGLSPDEKERSEDFPHVDIRHGSRECEDVHGEAWDTENDEWLRWWLIDYLP